VKRGPGEAVPIKRMTETEVFTCGEKTYQWQCVECDFSRLPWDSNSSATQTEPASDRPETGNRMQFYRRYQDDRQQENDWHDKRCSKTSHDKIKIYQRHDFQVADNIKKGLAWKNCSFLSPLYNLNEEWKQTVSPAGLKKSTCPLAMTSNFRRGQHIF